MISNAVCKSTREYRLWKNKSKNQIYDTTLKTEKLTIPHSLFNLGCSGVDIKDKFNYYTFGTENLLAKRVNQVYRKNKRCRKSNICKTVRANKNIGDTCFEIDEPVCIM